MTKSDDTATDLELARNIGELLFPKSSPVCSWCCIGVKNRMADGLGGDYFEFIAMPDGCQLICLGDVTGHGVHASIVMSLIYGFLHRATRGECAPLAVVRDVNRFLISFAERSEIFDQYFSTTLFLGVIDPATMRLTYVNAGHVPPLLCRDGHVTELCPTAHPLGFFTQAEIEAAEVVCEPGDRLLLYTDGIVEAETLSGEPFGRARLGELLCTGNPDYIQFLEELYSALADFSGEGMNRDDCTAIIVDFHAPWGLFRNNGGENDRGLDI